jgi:hypothetical protein
MLSQFAKPIDDFRENCDQKAGRSYQEQRQIAGNSQLNPINKRGKKEDVVHLPIIASRGHVEAFCNRLWITK